MTRISTSISKGLAHYRQELPSIVRWTKGQLDNAKGCGIPRFAVGFHGGKTAMTFTTGSNHDFPNAALVIEYPRRSLWGKSFIIVIMTGKYYVGVLVIQRLPNGLEGNVVTM